MSKSSIEWTEETWNTIGGCNDHSPGCLKCYARTMSARLEAMGQAKYTGVTRPGHKGPVWTGKINLDHASLSIPLKRKKSTMYFVNSMSDLFHKDVPNEFIAAVFGVMAATPWHTYQVLTKRAERLPEWFRWLADEYDGPCEQNAVLQMSLGQYLEDDGDRIDELMEDMLDAPWPLPNVWIGNSCEDRKHGLPRIDFLRTVPAAVRFLSIEPLLEDLGEIDLTGIHWVIVGGESGHGARPMHPRWVRDIRDQCVAAGVPFFFKQWGEWMPEAISPKPFIRINREGRDITRHGDLWHKDDAFLRRVGKKAAGRLLDGRTWDEMPTPAGVAR
jgi:protein gp37